MRIKKRFSQMSMEVVCAGDEENVEKGREIIRDDMN